MVRVRVGIDVVCSSYSTVYRAKISYSGILEYYTGYWYYTNRVGSASCPIKYVLQTEGKQMGKLSLWNIESLAYYMCLL
jgi:hypothetical protein